MTGTIRNKPTRSPFEKGWRGSRAARTRERASNYTESSRSRRNNRRERRDIVDNLIENDFHNHDWFDTEPILPVFSTRQSRFEEATQNAINEQYAMDRLMIIN